MKTLMIGKFSPDYSGGVESSFFGLAKRLAARCEVDVVCCSVDGRARVERVGEAACHCLATWFTLFSAPIAPALVGFLRRARYDVVILAFQNPMAALAYLLARPPGRLVVWWHHDIVKQRLLGLLLRSLLERVLERADVVVATSEAYAKSSAMLSRFQAKIEIIPLGIDLEPWERPEHVARGGEIRRREGSPLLAFVGRHVYYKGLRYLLEAMVGLDARLLAIGRGPLEEELKALSRRLGVAERVRFLDVPNGESVAPYLHAADLLVLPSSHRTEAFGLVLLEAMACGKPVVTTELGTGTSHVCQDGATGRVVPPQDPAALRAAIAGLLADPAAARAMGQAGRKRAQEFGADAMAAAFLELCRRLCEGRHAARA
ncbi:MAG: glycosyltransferase [Elusimicrobia bacterium]|nr:glycosyltransferase [Elusimicrobiota bacterium]